MTKFNDVTRSERSLKALTPYSNRAEEIKAAREKGLIVITARPCQLFIDCDSEEEFGYFLEQLKDFAPMIGIRSATYTRSPGGNYHAYITVERDMTPEEQVLLQACLGSDRRREIRTWKRLREKDPIGQLLFELPDVKHTPIDLEVL